MTPEIQAELIQLLVGVIVGLGTFAELLRRWINHKLDQSKKDREAERKQQASEFQAQLDERTTELRLRVKHEESDANVKEELFKLNRAHANSYEIQANAIHRIANVLVDHTGKVQDVGERLGGVELTMINLVDSVQGVASKVDIQIDKINDFIKDLLTRDSAYASTSAKEKEEILNTIKNLRLDLKTLSTMQAKIEEIEGVVARLDDTIPLPNLVTTDDTSSDNTPPTEKDDEKEDIA